MTKSAAEVAVLDSEKTIVSQSGTRHAISHGEAGQQYHRGRTTTMCGFGIRSNEDMPAAMRDCVYCVAAVRFGPTIREMVRLAGDAPTTEAAGKCGASVEEIHNAVAGATDLYWIDPAARTRINVIQGGRR